MSSKYDLDKLLDPYGAEKFQKTIFRITNPWKKYSAMNTVIPSIPAMYDNTVLEAMKNAVRPSIPAMYDNTVLEAMKNAVRPSIPAMYDNTVLEAMKNVVGSSIPAMYDNTVLEVMKNAALSIAVNESLGLQADIQRLIAAKTLMPDLNAKIFNLHQKLYTIAGQTEQRLDQNNFDSTHNYLDLFDEFNEKYNQDVHVDEAAIQTLDLVLHQPETLELISELRNIGIFDTSSGSIFLEYLETLPESKASTILNLILCIFLWFAEPIVNKYEPIQNLQEKSLNFLNSIEGKAFTTKDCELKAQPNGLKIMSLEKESLVIVYKNEDIVDGWSKIKFNKDGLDITGYIRTDEFNLLD